MRVLHGDCLEVLRGLPDASVDAVVTDPPYGLANTTPAQVAETLVRWVQGDRGYIPAGRGFMGKAWDAFVPPVAVWDECLRVLKPGGHLLAFAGSRTHDLMTLGVRLAGFDIRDSVIWHYASGFPKSLDVSKAIDKEAGAQRPVLATRRGAGIGGAASSFAQDSWTDAMRGPQDLQITAAATDASATWQGWGTALKPAQEPIVVARKPFAGTVAQNVQRWGTGALNIDATRVPGALGGDPNRFAKTDGGSFAAFSKSAPVVRAEGRWPSNAVFSHAPGCGPDGSTPCVPGCPVAELDQQSGVTRDGVATNRNREPGRGSWYGTRDVQTGVDVGYGGSGGASRYFPSFRYQAKAPTRERPKVDGVAHPTCKPVELMRWLVRLVTPPGGTLLDPFAGSGTTGEAAVLEGFDAILVEREAEYLPLIAVRVERAEKQVADAGSVPSQDVLDWSA